MLSFSFSRVGATRLAVANRGLGLPEDPGRVEVA